MTVDATDSVTAIGADDSVESRISERYNASMAGVLIPRYGFEAFLLVRTLADRHQHAAYEVKRGRLEAAQLQLEALERLHPRARELALTCRVSADPAWALLELRRGAPANATDRITAALDACQQLAGRFEHAHLTGRRLYLASHLVRIRRAEGDIDGALELTNRLTDVLHGDRNRWPFAGAATLAAELEADDTVLLEEQFEALRRSSGERSRDH